MEQFDDSGMTQAVADVYGRLQRQYPTLPPLRAIRVNPALRAAGLDGQYIGDGVIEVNPDVTDPARLERLLYHELSHAAGADEQKATILGNLHDPTFRPMSSHGPSPGSLGSLLNLIRFKR